jgi:hypothetical protein
MACPACLVAFMGPPEGPGQGFVQRRSVPYGDEPTQVPSLGALGAFFVAAAGAFVVLAVAMPAAGRRLSR